MTRDTRKEPISPLSHPVGDRSVFKRNADIVSSEFGGEESVLFNSRNRMSFLLNSTASRIYHLTNGQRSVRIICDVIAEHYSADQEQIKSDVKRIYRTFLERGIVIHGQQ